MAKLILFSHYILIFWIFFPFYNAYINLPLPIMLPFQNNEEFEIKKLASR